LPVGKKDHFRKGMLHAGALSQKKLKKKAYLFFWKLLGLQKKNIFHATDEQEREYIQKVFGKSARVMLAANFPRIFPFFQVIEKKAGHLKLVSIALISPMKNVLLVLESLVGSRESAEVGSSKFVVGKRQSEAGSLQSTTNYQLPAANFLEYNIYGPVKDREYWQSCLEVIKRMPANVVVKYHGEIPPGDIGNV